MIYLIKKNMSESCFEEFFKDYTELLSIKGSEVWLKAKKRLETYNRKAEPITSLSEVFSYNRCNYSMFKTTVLNEPTIAERLDLFDNNYHQQRAILLFYTIDIYIGFLVEFILCEKLKTLGYKIDQNGYLDRIGIDFICGNIPFQMKNYSFLLNNRTMTDYTNRHKELQTLNFIFYEVSADNINFCLLNNNPYTNIKYIDGFTVHQKKENLSFNEYVSALISTIERK